MDIQYRSSTAYAMDLDELHRTVNALRKKKGKLKAKEVNDILKSIIDQTLSIQGEILMCEISKQYRNVYLEGGDHE